MANLVRFTLFGITGAALLLVQVLPYVAGEWMGLGIAVICIAKAGHALGITRSPNTHP